MDDKSKKTLTPTQRKVWELETKAAMTYGAGRVLLEKLREAHDEAKRLESQKNELLMSAYRDPKKIDRIDDEILSLRLYMEFLTQEKSAYDAAAKDFRLLAAEVKAAFVGEQSTKKH